MTNKEVESWINDTLEVQLSELKEEQDRILRKLNKDSGDLMQKMD